MTVALVSQGAAQTPPRQSPVDIAIPQAPTPATVDGARLLVYELHVTNFGARPLKLQRVDVFDRDRGKELLALNDSALLHAFRLLGGAPVDSTNIAPGRRGIVFLWISLGTGEPIPASLRHRLTFGLADSAGTFATTAASMIDSLNVSVRPQAAIELSAPFTGGDWLAGDGPANDSDHRRALTPLDGRARISQRFAVDWVMIGPNGNTWHEDRTRNENYWGFGQPVQAVDNGVVSEIVDSIADNVPHSPLPTATVTNISGNHVIVRLSSGQFVMFAHLKRGSIRVRPGERVIRGETIAQLGNSGQSSGPHLHFQVMDASSPLASEGLPFVFDHFTFLGLGRDYEPDKHVTAPRGKEMPLGDAVIRFR